MQVGEEVERKEEAFGKSTCSRNESLAVDSRLELGWASGLAQDWATAQDGLAGRAGRAGQRAGPGCARGREALGQSSPGLALAPPPGGEAKVRQESLLCPTLRTDGVGGGGDLRPKCIPSSKDRSRPPNSRPATSLLTSSASSLKTSQEASEAGQLRVLATSLPRRALAAR